MWTFFDPLICAGGSAACWISIDTIIRLVTGRKSFVWSLEVKATAWKERL